MCAIVRMCAGVQCVRMWTRRDGRTALVRRSGGGLGEEREGTRAEAQAEAGARRSRSRLRLVSARASQFSPARVLAPGWHVVLGFGWTESASRRPDVPAPAPARLAGWPLVESTPPAPLEAQWDQVRRPAPRRLSSLYCCTARCTALLRRTGLKVPRWHWHAAGTFRSLDPSRSLAHTHPSLPQPLSITHRPVHPSTGSLRTLAFLPWLLPSCILLLPPAPCTLPLLPSLALQGATATAATSACLSRWLRPFLRPPLPTWLAGLLALSSISSTPTLLHSFTRSTLFQSPHSTTHKSTPLTRSHPSDPANPTSQSPPSLLSSFLPRQWPTNPGRRTGLSLASPS